MVFCCQLCVLWQSVQTYLSHLHGALCQKRLKPLNKEGNVGLNFQVLPRSRKDKVCTSRDRIPYLLAQMGQNIWVYGNQVLIPRFLSDIAHLSYKSMFSVIF